MRQRIMHGAEIDVVTPDELAAALAQRRANVVLGMGGGATERLSEDLPIRGTLRQITSYHRGRGADNLILAAGVFTQLCEADPARVAGNVQNTGANSLYVYGALVRDINAPFGAVTQCLCGYIAASGAWDFTWSNDVWCGPVTLYSALGTSITWGTH